MLKVLSRLLNRIKLPVVLDYIKVVVMLEIAGVLQMRRPRRIVRGKSLKVFIFVVKHHFFCNVKVLVLQGNLAPDVLFLV